MGHLENCLKMINLLRTNNRMKKKELSEILEVSERQIKRYKEALDLYFDIEEKPGIYGGYKLIDDNGYFPTKNLLKEHEIYLINDFVQTIDSNLFGGSEELMNAISKINFTFNKNSNFLSNSIIPYSKVKPMSKEEENRLLCINKAILEDIEIIINYRGNNENSAKKRRVQPYKLITYKGEKYLVAFCLLKKDIRFFKLSRIINLEYTTIKFQKKIDINKLLEEKRKNSIGIFGGKEYKLNLKISPPIANTIAERIWVDNQEITYLDDGKIIFKAVMKGEPEIISWILSMGTSVEIIEPNELREKIKKILEEMINKF